MPLTTAQQVRLRIQDQWRRGYETQISDGVASGFQLAQGSPYSVIISATASIPVAAGWSASGCAFDTGFGYAVFATGISANSAVRFDYQWAVFGDDAIDQFIAAGEGNTVAGAALQAVRTLRFNAPKRSRWAAPDGTQHDDTRVSQDLKDLEEDLLAEVIRNVEGPAGDYTSWSYNQSEY